jgi:hypothetical protein
MEVWSIGEGGSRVYCGVATTDEGFAVDVFRGDTCLESADCATYGEAVHRAGELRARYDALRGASLLQLDPIDLPEWDVDGIVGGCSVAGAAR